MLEAHDDVDAERASRHTKHWPAIVPRAELSLSMMTEESLWIDDMLFDMWKRMPGSTAGRGWVSLERTPGTHRCTTEGRACKVQAPRNARPLSPHHPPPKTES